MLSLADKLSKEKVDAVLAKLLPNEKSPRRRLNRLESFIFTKSQESMAWMENYLLANGKPATEEILDKEYRQSSVISIAVLYEFEVYLRDEAFMREHPNGKTPELIEARTMDNEPGRWMSRFPQNRMRKTSRNVSAAVYDAVVDNIKQKGDNPTAAGIFAETTMILDWHPEVENGDRVSECRWSEESGDWELVVVKPDGQIIGHPTKTIEDIAKEGIIARSRTTGTSGRKLVLEDAFLGILSA